jgi:high-affinity nickel permease
MEELSLAGVLMLGFLLGVRHAFDADHLAAVMSLVTEGAPLRKSWMVGTLWGLGHTTALLVAALVVLAIGAQIPDRLALALELAVAGMLVLLGVRVLYLMARGKVTHLHVHRHGERLHIHPHQHEKGQAHDRVGIAHHGTGKRSYVVGLVHGLAGSAALLLVVANSGSTVGALVYVLMFGVGSVGGMLVMSTLMTAPFAWTLERLPAVNQYLRGAAGVGSIAVGLVLAYWVVVF